MEKILNYPIMNGDYYMKRLFIMLPSLLFGLTAQTQNVVDLSLLIHDSIVVGGSMDYLKETRDKIDQLTGFPCDIIGDTIWGIEILETSPGGACNLSYWTNSFVISATCSNEGNFMVVKNERLVDSCMIRWVATWQKDTLTPLSDSVTTFSYVIYRPIRVIFKDEKILFSTFEFADIHYYISYEDSEEIRKKWRN